MWAALLLTIGPIIAYNSFIVETTAYFHKNDSDVWIMYLEEVRDAFPREFFRR